MLAAAWRWRSGGGGSVKRGGGAQRNGGSAGAAARRLRRWRQWDVGGSGTVRECTNARTFKRNRRTNIRVFVLGQGQRDNSVNSIVIVGSKDVAREDVHCGWRAAAAAAASVLLPPRCRRCAVPCRCALRCRHRR
jgi:hypothetical protein